jgi:hypothetical protein
MAGRHYGQPFFSGYAQPSHALRRWQVAATLSSNFFT